MRRIAHVINTADIGGGAEHVLALARHTGRAGYDNAVVVGRDGPVRARMRDAGVPVVVLGPMGITSPLRLARVLRSLRPGLLHLHGSRSGVTGTIAAALAGVRPVVYTAHAFAFKRRLPAMLRWLAARADAFTCARADRVICLTRGDVDAARTLGVLRGDAVIIPNGIDPGRFAAAADRRGELGINARVPVAGFIGRLVPDKDPVGFVTVARAVADALPDARFIIVGDGPLRPQVEAAATQRGLASHLIMAGVRTDIPELLATMDVVVLTSHWEGMPMVVLEAMASARPVVAPALPGLDEVVEDGVTGRLTPPGDLAALAEAVIALLQDAGARRRLGERGRGWVYERFTLERMIDRTLEVYREVTPL